MGETFLSSLYLIGIEVEVHSREPCEGHSNCGSEISISPAGLSLLVPSPRETKYAGQVGASCLNGNFHSKSEGPATRLGRIAYVAFSHHQRRSYHRDRLINTDSSDRPLENHSEPILRINKAVESDPGERIGLPSERLE